MLTKSHLNAVNSLQTKAIRKFVSTFVGHPTAGDSFSDLNLHLRQAVVDYLVEEKVESSAQLVQSLVTGGLKSLDLWRLCQTNTFTTSEVMTILETIGQNRQSFESLSLGGNDWIFNPRVVRGPLRRLFEGPLSQLVALRLQQMATHEDLLAVLRSCPRLKRLEISLPCLTDRDIDRIEEQLKSCPSVANIKELLLPSSFKQRSLMKVLAIFANLKSLKCVPFEQLMDLIEFSVKSTSKTVSETALKARQTLSSLTSLTITQPMSCDAIGRLVSFCPRLKTFNLEVQMGNDLSAISRLADIRQLELRNSTSLPIQWSHIVPVMEGVGAHLTGLSLEHFDVDLTTCAKLCPNLLRFSAQWFTLLGYTRPNLPSSLRDRHFKPFSNLTHLRLRPLSGRNIPSDGCAFALSYAKHVSHIELYCCYDLSDSDVQALHSKNPMSELRSLILRHGHKVTKDALNLLVSKADGLSYIDCGIPLKKEDSDPDP